MLLILTNRQFRLLWAGGAVAGLAGMVLFMAHAWLTLTVTNSPFWLGVTSGVSGVGMMAASGVGGVLADRVPRRRLLVWSALARGALAGLLAIPIFLERVHLWQLLAVALANGVVEALWGPAFTALTMDVVGRGRVMSANAANFAAMGVAGVLAPLLGAAVISAWGIQWACIMAATAGLAGVPPLLGISSPDSTAGNGTPLEVGRSRREAPWPAFKRGASYVFGTPSVRALILMGLVGEFFGWAHMTMVPVMARDVLGSGVTGLGYLSSASFGGWLLASLAMSGMADVRQKGRMLVIGGVGFSLLIIAFAASRYLPLSLVLFAGAYIAGAFYEVSLITLLQTVVPDEMRGRVISFQAFTWGANGLSGFHTGAIARWLGAPWAIVLGAGIMLAYVLRLAPQSSRLQEPSEEVS